MASVYEILLFLTWKYLRHGRRVSEYPHASGRTRARKYVMVGRSSWFMRGKPLPRDARGLEFPRGWAAREQHRKYALFIYFFFSFSSSTCLLYSRFWHSIFKGHLGIGYTIHTDIHGKLGRSRDGRHSRDPLGMVNQFHHTPTTLLLLHCCDLSVCCARFCLAVCTPIVKDRRVSGVAPSTLRFEAGSIGGTRQGP